MTGFHSDPTISPEENTERAEVWLKDRGLWDDRPECADQSWQYEFKSQMELVLI
jgi:hypothetical protein